MEKVRWGFIGAGSIARKALYPALINSQISEIYAVAGKDSERAKTLSPSGKIYTDYQDLINDPLVEAIYISLPNSLHIPWSIKAMQAGKHVLCEKPLAMNAREVIEATKVAQSTGRFFMEASWNRWHPRTNRIKELVKSGIIGKITSINAGFTYKGLDPVWKKLVRDILVQARLLKRPSSFRLIPELGGGSLYDLGPYSIVAPLWLLDFAPISNIKTETAWHPGGCDETLRASYTIGEVKVQALTSVNVPDKIYFEITGTEGKIATGGNDAFVSHNKPSTLEIDVKGEKIVENFGACDPYQLMADSFANKIRGNDAWIMPLTESLAFAQFFDQIFATMRREAASEFRAV